MKKTLQRFVLLLLRGLAITIGHILFDVRIAGKDNIPSKGGALIVANHVSYLDFLLILIALPRHASFVMNADVYPKPLLRFFFDTARCIPIAPRGGKNNFEDFNAVVSQRIIHGEIVVIFAEGTVTRTGQLLEFKKGIEHIARLIQQPVIPIQLYNASGSPFTFKAGIRTMQKIRWNNLRRSVFTRIGKPISPPILAFELRQKIKELEVENLEAYLDHTAELPETLHAAIHKQNNCGWNIQGRQISYIDLRNKLRALDQSLSDVFSDAHCVAILAPKSIDSMAIMLWLMLRRITIVPLPESLNNEEQLFAINKSKADWLIATRDLNYTRVAPTADQLIYIEDICSAQIKGTPVPVVCRNAKRFQQSVLNLFRAPKTKNELAFVLFQKQKLHSPSCTGLSYRNLSAVIQGLRQVYFFEKSTVQLSDLPQCHAHGIVMELLLPLLHDMALHVATTDGPAHNFIEQLKQLQPSLAIATPTQLAHLADLAAHQNLPYLTHVFTAAVLPNDPSVTALRDRGIEVFVCAGSNETSSVFAINLNDYIGKDIVGKGMHQENQNANSIGKALPGVAIRIANENGGECPVDAVGLLWIKGPSVAHMLHTDSDCTRRLHDGWLNTELAASIDKQGFISIHSSTY